MSNTDIQPPPAATYYSDKFETINEELRLHFGVANQEIEKVKEKVNELVVLVHNDNPKWSVKRICEYIAGKNDDLEHLGFSSRTIQRYLNDENRQLVDSKKYKRQKGDSTTAPTESQSLKDFREEKGTMLQNNVIDSFQDYASPEIVPEDSSRTKTLPNAYDVKDAETTIITWDKRNRR